MQTFCDCSGQFIASAAQTDFAVSCPLSNNLVAQVASSNDKHFMTLAVASPSPFLSPVVPGEHARRGDKA